MTTFFIGPSKLRLTWSTSTCGCGGAVFLQDGAELNGPGLRDALRQRFAAIDFGGAVRDVEPFIEDAGQLRLWSAGFFKQITEGLAVA